MNKIILISILFLSWSAVAQSIKDICQIAHTSYQVPKSHILERSNNVSLQNSDLLRQINQNRNQGALAQSLSHIARLNLEIKGSVIPEEIHSSVLNSFDSFLGSTSLGEEISSGFMAGIETQSQLEKQDVASIFEAVSKQSLSASFSSVEIYFDPELEEMGAAGLFDSPGLLDVNFPLKLGANATKRIRLNPFITNLFDLALVYAHEKLHGVDAIPKATLRQKMMLLPGGPLGLDPACINSPDSHQCEVNTKKRAEVESLYYQTSLVEELEAFDLMINLFKEAVLAVPQICQLVFHSEEDGFFNPAGTFSLAEKYSFIEEKYIDGSIAIYVSGYYVDHANYNSGYLFTDDSRSNLRSDFVTLIRASGF